MLVHQPFHRYPPARDESFDYSPRREQTLAAETQPSYAQRLRRGERARSKRREFSILLEAPCHTRQQERPRGLVAKRFAGEERAEARRPGEIGGNSPAHEVVHFPAQII